MKKRIIKMILSIILILLILTVLTLIFSRFVTGFVATPLTYQPSDIPSAPVAIVFGAGLQRDGSPSSVLRDRVLTAVELYKTGKVQKILMSGDNRFLNYNEPGAMFEYASELGVPPTDIVLDYAGQRTYDTCFRAKSIFGVSEAILVTQKFHLPRALFTCNSLGVKAVGAIADKHNYFAYTQVIWFIRETFASMVALWDIWVAHPTPILGKPEPIFPINANIDLGNDFLQIWINKEKN
jgi:SanA protein